MFQFQTQFKVYKIEVGFCRSFRSNIVSSGFEAVHDKDKLPWFTSTLFKYQC